jgi:hypothetical protein
VFVIVEQRYQLTTVMLVIHPATPSSLCGEADERGPRPAASRLQDVRVSELGHSLSARQDWCVGREFATCRREGRDDRYVYALTWKRSRSEKSAPSANRGRHETKQPPAGRPW